MRVFKTTVTDIAVKRLVGLLIKTIDIIKTTYLSDAQVFK